VWLVNYTVLTEARVAGLATDVVDIEAENNRGATDGAFLSSLLQLWRTDVKLTLLLTSYLYGIINQIKGCFHQRGDRRG
jgi:hypothetical protein